MSRKGAVNTNNNGGAHTQPHGVHRLIENSEQLKKTDGKYPFIEAENVSENVGSNQDGGLCISSVKTEILGSVSDLPVIVTDNDTVSDSDSNVCHNLQHSHDNATVGFAESVSVSIRSTPFRQTRVQTLQSQTQQHGAVCVSQPAHVVNVGDWIKVKPDQPGELVFFDPGSSNSEADGDEQLMASKLREKLTPSDNVSSNSANTIATSSTPNTILVPIIANDTDSDPDRAIMTVPSNDGSVGMLVKLSDLGDPLTLSLPESSALPIKSEVKPKLTATRMDPLAGSIDNLLDPSLILSHDDRSQLSSQDRACLEEIERGSKLTAEEEELMEQVISPQELQNLPDQTLDLETELQSKPMSVVTEDGGASTASLDKPSGLLNISDLQKIISSSASIGAINNIVSMDNSEVQSTLAGAAKSASMQSVVTVPSGASGNAASNAGVATVQITTNNIDNTTQILVNTGSGIQLYQVNTADLEQAADAFQPLLSQQANAVVSKARQNHEGERLLVPISKATSSPMQQSHSQNPLTAQAENTSAVTSVASGEKSWPCNVEGCGQRFIKPSQLKVHLMNHTGDRPFKCPVEGCDWAFTTGHKLRRHQEVHKGTKNYVCDEPGCGKKFTTVYNLRTHKKWHTRECTFQCPKEGCGEKFLMQKQLDKHLKVHGSALKTYKCPYEGCERLFYSRLCMGSHARVHQRNLDLTCHFEGCGRVFDKLCRLKAHLRSHTGERPYPCPFPNCTWAFVTSSKLRRHLQKHTGERQFACPHEGCDKRFMRAEHLKGHMVVHTGTKPFACTIDGCEARFTAKSTLYMHIKKHRMNAHQKVTYFCPLEGCNQKYNNKAALRAHIEKHYQKQLPSVTGGGDVSLLSAVDLQGGAADSLLQQHSDTAAVNTEVAQVTGLMTLDGTTINPADVMAAGDQPLIMGPNNLIGSLNQGMTSIPVTIDLGNGQVGQVTLQGVLGPVQGLVTVPTSTAGAEAPPTLPLDLVETEAVDAPRVIIAPDMDHSSPPGDNTSSSARTDYHGNQVLSHRAKMRQQRIKGKSGVEVKLEDNVILSPGKGKDAAAAESEPAESSAIFSLSDMMTSQAITFRDPETGAIYVQTQLLQDDPPNPEAFDDAGMDTSNQSGLEAEFSSMLQDGHSSNVADTGGSSAAVVEFSTAEFSGSTINLQDLE